MKNLKWLLSAIVLPLLFACTADSTSFEIVVKGGEHFPEDAKVVIYRTRLDSVKKVEFIHSEGFKNGQISCKGVVTSAHIVNLVVVTAEEKSLSGDIYMALEPGKTEVNFSSMTDFTFKGGKYSEMLINPVNNDPSYQKAKNAFWDFNNKGLPMNDEKNFKEYYRLASESAIIRSKILTQVYKQQEDPLAKLLLHNAGYYSEDWKDDEKTKEELANQLVDNREALVTKAKFQYQKKNLAARSKLEVGKTIKDFKVSNLEGEELQLSEVLKKNKYVLVELWASWCKPCRAEIPHMKRAYEVFHERGFEIFSFSMDHKRKAWEKASNKENIPWINTSDLKASDSPVAIMFGNPALPSNWLIEASTGKIIAKHLRGKALDHKLEELLK